MQQYKFTVRTRADLAETDAISITFQLSILWSNPSICALKPGYIWWSSGSSPLEIHLKRDTILTKQVY